MSISSIGEKSMIAVNPSEPKYKLRRQTTGAFAVFHLLAVLALLPWFFSWEGVVSVLVGNYLFGSLGICLG